MPSLFSDLSFLWSFKATSRLLHKAGTATAAPFEVLHRIHWSAPWHAQSLPACGARKGF